MDVLKTLFIPCAGTGSRVSKYSNGLNKALITIKDKPVISYIIEAFPEDWEIVVALGYGGEVLRDFLRIAYPKRSFKFVEISKWEGDGSGLALTLHESRHLLQKPFIFWANDTICTHPTQFKSTTHNVVIVTKDQTYDNLYRKFWEGWIIGKDECKGNCYVGVAAINDYQKFWEVLSPTDPDGECSALNHLKLYEMHTQAWWDTGNEDTITKIHRRAHNILPKMGEEIWFVNDLVIKYHHSETFISNRVKRAELLRDYAPEIVGVAKHLYAYKKVRGDILSKCLNKQLFAQLLGVLPSFWRGETTISKEASLKFYRDKTYDRVTQYLAKNPDYTDINDVPYDRIMDMLRKIDWKHITTSASSRWHGDLHFDNIISTQDGFKSIDWREDFAGEMKGDHYYDLAKLYHGMIFPHDVFANNKFKFGESKNNCFFDYNISHEFVMCIDTFNRFCHQYWFDLQKVRLITALVFLNMAPLHPGDVGKICFALGKEILSQCLYEHQIDF